VSPRTAQPRSGVPDFHRRADRHVAGAFHADRVESLRGLRALGLGHVLADVLGSGVSRGLGRVVLPDVPVVRAIVAGAVDVRAAQAGAPGGQRRGRARRRTVSERLIGLLAEFADAEQLRGAVLRARHERYAQPGGYSPYPVGGLTGATGARRRHLTFWIVRGAASGAALTYSLQWF